VVTLALTDARRQSLTIGPGWCICAAAAADNPTIIGADDPTIVTTTGSCKKQDRRCRECNEGSSRLRHLGGSHYCVVSESQFPNAIARLGEHGFLPSRHATTGRRGSSLRAWVNVAGTGPRRLIRKLTRRPPKTTARLSGAAHHPLDGRRRGRSAFGAEQAAALPPCMRTGACRDVPRLIGSAGPCGIEVEPKPTPRSRAPRGKDR